MTHRTMSRHSTKKLHLGNCSVMICSKTWICIYRYPSVVSACLMHGQFEINKIKSDPDITIKGVTFLH